MTHELDLIYTLASGLTAALLFGYFTHKIGLSPIVGYLLAGVVVGPFTPGYVADHAIAGQFAEIGVILLLFGVGLHFHLKDLIAVKNIAIPGALVQIVIATGLGTLVGRWAGWSTEAGLVFGIAISVASTVVLTRVLADNRALHTPIGHIAVGWLVVEDVFTVLVLVVLPTIFQSQQTDAFGLALALGTAMLKIVALIAFTFLVGRKVIPKILGYVARTHSRELFTLTVLVLVLGIAIGSAKLFGASMALGAFLAGMVVGQSEFSSRAATEALPMRDAFAVLFFVSVGMLFDPAELATQWPLVLATCAVILIGKPLAAFIVVMVLRSPLKVGLSVAVALSQIGEFSFILAALAERLGVLPRAASSALIAGAIVSITLNPLLYRAIGPVSRLLGRLLPIKPPTKELEAVSSTPLTNHAVVVGYGPVGRTLSRVLRDNGITVAVIEMNLDTVNALHGEGIAAVYGDAIQPGILAAAGIQKAASLVCSVSGSESAEIIRVTRELRPELMVLARSSYLRDAAPMNAAGADEVFSGEGEVALSMAVWLLASMGATREQIDRESERVRRELFHVANGS